MATSTMLLLLAPALLATLASATQQLYQCPNLGIGNCTADDGLAFFDGCRTVACKGWHSAAFIEFIQCRPAAGSAELATCRRLGRRLAIMQGGSSDAGVRCPQFASVDICATADMFFSYQDGCNFHLCDGAGGALERTSKTCPSASTPEQLFFCAATFNAVVRTHNRKHACREQAENAERICQAMWPGYRFGDPCYQGHDYVCGPGRRLLMRPQEGACPLFSEGDSIKCRFVANEVADLLSPVRGFTCAQLQYSAVCTEENRGFVYNDGCNQVMCDGPSAGLTEGRVCKLPFDSRQRAGRSYCDQRVEEVRRRLASSRLHTQPCTTAQEACPGPAAEGQSYSDGCNFCTCLGAGRAQCTRRGCVGFFGTTEEFAAHCRTASYRLE